MNEKDNSDSHRREFLRKAGTTAAITGLGSSTTGTAAAEYSDLGREPAQTTTFGSDPFTLGVASGDPLPDSVVLWTRLAPAPLEANGGMPDRRVPVQWAVTTDENLNDIVANGSTNAVPASAHSVHIDVTGLNPDTEYYYQFTAGSYRSPIGRTKTAPAADANVGEFRFAFVSCQDYPKGYYTAYQHLAAENLDAVVHLGDYIYEGNIETSLNRSHEPSDGLQSVDDYRIRYAQYKREQPLRDAHAAFPWIVTWDDHEVVDNYADENADGVPPEEFLERRANAYRAFFEHQPLRPSRMPDGPDLPLYRRFTFGGLVEFNVLDTRQYRDDIANSTEETQNPERTILGDEQENWLVDGLQNSTSRWNVLANQVLMSSIDISNDWWDGYQADRETVLETMARGDVPNPIVITGDIHRNYAYDLKADFSDPSSRTVGTEYVGTSITTGMDGSGLTQYGQSATEPWQRFFNDDRGYVRCTVTPERWQADYRVVSTVEEPTASVHTVASFATEAGIPGATVVSERPEREPIAITGTQQDERGSESENSGGVAARLHNTGDTAIDLSGFVLSFQSGALRVPTDNEADRYMFGNFILKAGGTVTVRAGSGEDTGETLYTGTDSSRDRGALVANAEGIVLDEESYPLPAADTTTAETPRGEPARTDTTGTGTTTASGTETAGETTETTRGTTATRSPTADEAAGTETSANTDGESGSAGPGFGILAALAGLAGIAARRLTRRERE